MRAAIFYGKGDVRVEEVERLAPSPTDLLVKVMACGICGTDVHIFEGAKGAAETHPPVILGHEFSGIVEAVGELVQGFAPGDRICIDPNNTCGSCYSCRRGEAHFCENMIGYGTTTDGGFSEYCLVHYKQAYRLPDSVSFEEGAMAEPISCCLHGIDRCGIKTGDTVLILGAGMIGLIMLQLSRLAGATTIIVSEPVEEKRLMAEKLGADMLFDPLVAPLHEQLSEAGFEHINSVIECAGLKQTMAEAIRCASRNSTVMLFGLCGPDDEIPVKPFEIFQKELTITASYINPYTEGRALDIIASGKVELKSLMAEMIPLEELQSVLADPARRRNGKVVVLPWKK